jgi:aspartate carbamoyltransferase catalytic subunit
MTRTHFLDIQSLPFCDIERVLDRAQQLSEGVHGGYPLKDKAVALLFFEPSTRTCLSFERAVQKLGGHVLSFNPNTSSTKKGETLLDTLQTIQALGVSCMVIRHCEDGGPAQLAAYMDVPLINAGDGCHEHPSQALADALTMRHHFGTLKGLHVLICGDIKHSRVARSNLWLLHKAGAYVHVCGPKEMMPDTFPVDVRRHDVFEDALEGVDVVMMLRVQFERQATPLTMAPDVYHRLYGLTHDRRLRCQSHVLVLHPGPVNRGVEIADEVLDNTSTGILTQVQNGVWVRMAILEALTQQ